MTGAEIAMVALTAVSGLVSYESAQSQARATKDSEAYNASVAAQNSQAALDQADQNAMLQQIQSKKTIGAMAAKYGASGVDMSGSALDALGNSAASAEMDRQTILYKGRVQAAGYQDEQELDVARGENAIKQGNQEGAGAILSSAGQIAGQFNMGGGSSTKKAKE